MQYALHQNNNNGDNNNNAQQYAMQQQSPQQPQQQQNNNINQQINQMQQQQSNQQQINAQMQQLNAMQHQFNQFQINSNQQSPPQNNQQQKPAINQNSQQTSPQNVQFQQQSTQQSQQFAQFHAAQQNAQQNNAQMIAAQQNAQNQFNAINAAQHYQNAANYAFAQQQNAANGGTLFGQMQQPNVAQLASPQQAETSIDVEASSLNPEIAEFNPMNGGASENAAAVQLTVQEQLFASLQNINVQMQSIKRQTESVLTPTLMQLQSSIAMFQQNPGLLQNQMNYAQFFQTQQQYQTIAYQIQQNQLNYHQLEQSLKYTQEMYQKNKDEQYVVPMDEELEQNNDGQTQINDESNSTNPYNASTNGATYSLTSAVTDVGSSGLQQMHPNNWDNQIINGQDNNNENDDVVAEEHQQQQQTNDHLVTNGNIVQQTEEGNTQHIDKQEDITQDVRSKANIVSFDDHFNKFDRFRSPQQQNSRFARTENENSQFFGASKEVSLQTSKSYPSTQRDFEQNKSPMIEQQSSVSSDVELSDDGDEDLMVNDDEMDEQKEQKQKINPGETCYAVMDLIKMQSQFLSINWREDAFKAIPRSVRFVAKGVNNEKYMNDVVAMFMRKASNPWLAASHTGAAPTDKKTKCLKRMTGVLNKMTPEKFEKISKQTLDGINDFAETKQEMNTIIGLILEFGIKQPVFGGQYALLCQKVYDHLPRLTMICDYEWLVNDDDVSTTFRKMVIQQTNNLFTKHRKYDIPLPSEKELKYKEDIEMAQRKRKQNFFAVMELVAEIYNVALIKKNLIYKGVVDPLLPPKNENLSSVDVEGLCRLFKRCGKKLDVQGKKYVDKYLQKLSTHVRKFDFRTKVLVDEIKEMRARDWKHRLKKEVAKTLDELHKDIQEEEDAANAKKSYYNGNGRRDNSRKGNNKRRKDRDYDSNYYEVGDYEDKKHRNGNDYRRKKGGDRYQRKNKYEDDYEETSKNGSRYKQKRKVGGNMTATKSIGSMYQKKSPKKVGFLQRSQSAIIVPENHASPNKLFKKLRGFIDEYMVSCDMSDIEEYLNQKHVSIEVWAKVISDGFQNRKPTQMSYFIEFIVIMFEKEYLEEKNFINAVIKLLVSEIDDASMDAPLFKKHVSTLFAHICWNEYVEVNACFNYFIKKYQQCSSYKKGAQNKTINKMITMSIDELNNFKGSSAMIKKVRSFCV